jgi:WD40 repeat protein
VKRIYLLVFILLTTALACTLSRDGDGEDSSRRVRTPTAILISDAEATATRVVEITQSPQAIASGTSVSAPPTRLPTLFPTPLQFSTPVGNVAAVPPPVVSSDGGGNVVPGTSGLTVSTGNPEAGAPQNGGYFFPNAIVFTSGNGLRTVNRDGSGGASLGQAGQTVRSISGLLVASSAGGVNVIRPDGQGIASGSNQTTLPSWSRDNQVAYYGSGGNLVRFAGGNTEVVNSVNGEMIRVQHSPDGGTVLFASRGQIKLLHGDGNVSTRWESGDEQITEGPYWAVRDGRLGVYAVLSSGRRIFIGDDLSNVDNPNEHLQLLSPVNDAARVYVRGQDGGTQRLVAVWPGAADVEFTARSITDVSWSPDGSQLVYASPGGDLILLDAANGSQQTIASGGASAPLWTTPRYTVRQ